VVLVVPHEPDLAPSDLCVVEELERFLSVLVLIEVDVTKTAGVAS